MKQTLLLIALTLITFPTLAQDYDFGDVSKEELLETEHPEHPDASASILYREYKTRFSYSEEYGFFAITEVQERIKIYNKEGYKYADVAFKLHTSDGRTKDTYNGLKAFTYNLEGGKVKKEKLKNNGIFEEEASKYTTLVKFAMPNVNDGSIIEYKYELQTPYIYNLDEYSLQEFIPIKKSVLKFTSPEYFGWNLHQRGTLPLNVEQGRGRDKITYDHSEALLDKMKDVGSQRHGKPTINTRNTIDVQTDIYDLELSNVPPLKDEAYTNNVNNYKNSLKFEVSFRNLPGKGLETVTTTWDNITETIYRSSRFGNELDKKGYFKSDLERILNTSNTEEEIVFNIYEFVKKKMNWNDYVGIYTDEGVVKAYRTNTGNSADINLMLTAMLREAGITSNPVLVSTRDHGIPVSPTINGFNFVISSATINQELYLLDATNKNGSVNFLEEHLLNWNGRQITEDGRSRWINLNPTSHSENNTIMSLKFDEAMQIEGSLNSKITGHSAYNFKKRFNRKSEDELVATFESDYPNVKFGEYSFKNHNKTYEPILYSYKFNVEKPVDVIEDKCYLTPMLHLADLQNPFVLEDRTFPIDYQYPRKTNYIVNIAIPDGYNVSTLPESTKVLLPEELGEFLYKAKQVGNNVQVSYQFVINSNLVPSKYYNELKTFYNLAIEKQEEKIVFVKS